MTLCFRPPLPLTAAIALALAGCASTAGDYPSLAPRSVEQAPAPAAPEPTSPPADPRLAAETAPILAAADKGHAEFLAQLERTRAAIDAARGAAPGGEAWVAAQVALSALDTARGPVLGALADLDSLRIRMLEVGRNADAESLADAVRQIEARESEERAALAPLSGALAEIEAAGG